MISRSICRAVTLCFFPLILTLGLSAQAQSIPNPSFEADTDYTPPGYRTNITGWVLSGGSGHGLNPAGGTFANNGAVPNGVNVAFLQGVTKLSTTITGLTAGEAYRVLFRANARAGNFPLGQCALNGQSAIGFTSAPSVGGSNPYYHVQQTFIATGATALLEISTLNTGADATLLVDDFSIASAAATYTVTTLSDDYTVPPAGSLRAAINQANADQASATIVFDIPFGGTINLASNASGARMLPILSSPNGITINGENAGQGPIVINGGNGDRILFIGVPANTPASAGGNLPSTAATGFLLANLTLQNGYARGGNGGTGDGGGGGGAGLGGAIFLNAGNLSLSNVVVRGSRAIGGTGGAGADVIGNSGGGGMGGAGGAGGGRSGGGGGGFGNGANAGFNGAAGNGGIFSAARGGGAGTDGGGAGGTSGGGGGAGGTTSGNSNSGGGGGVGGQDGSSSGGAGGFGGGGGGNGNFSSGRSSGGFGGGESSGGLALGDGGGFGGGGGGTFSNSVGGVGGFGAGTGGNGGPAFPLRGVGGGGGGLGAGGAIFVRQGAALKLSDVGFSANSVMAGGGGAGFRSGSTPGTAGSAIGQDIFLAGSANYYVPANAVVTLAVANIIAGGNDSQITGGLTKTGDGTLSLNAANSYTGGTIVSGGTLLVNASSATGSGGVAVNTGGTLGGTGTIGSAITVNSGGKLAPGNGPGILNTGNVDFASGSTFSVEINGASVGSQYDQLNATGTVSISNASLFLAVSYDPSESDSFVLINNDGSDPIVGTFSGLPEGSAILVGGVNQRITYEGGTGNDVAIIVGPAPRVLYAGTNLVNGTIIDYGTIDLGSASAAKTFTVVKGGVGVVRDLTTTKTGTNPGDFIVSPLDSTTVDSGTNATFTITFSPTASLNRSATIEVRGFIEGAGIGPNWIFRINVSGTAFITQAVYEANRAAGVSDVTNNPNAYSLYTTSQVKALHVGVPLLRRNPTDGSFTLIIGVQKSTNLVDFFPFPITAPQTMINTNGELEFRFSSPDDAAFFRLESQ